MFLENESKDTLLFAGTESGIYRSTDFGEIWAKSDSGLTSHYVQSFVCMNNKKGPIIFAGTFDGVFCSSNDGLNWNAVNSGLSDRNALCLAADGVNLFAGTGGGIFLSTDYGNNWSEVNNGLTSKWVNALTVNHDLLGRSIIFAGTRDGVFSSADSGANWTAVNNGLIYKNVLSLASASVEGWGNYIFAGTKGGGLYFSSDNGNNWSDGFYFDDESVYALAKNETKLFAGTENIGVWLSDIQMVQYSDVGSSKAKVSQSFVLVQNYPNPFNPSTTICYSIPGEFHVELKVYDLLGREIATLVDREQNAGEYRVQFDGTNLPSGIYIYSIQAGQYRDSKKLLLLK